MKAQARFAEPATPEVRELLERRAERLREKPRSSTEEESLLWVAEFPIGEESYALPLDPGWYPIDQDHARLSHA